MPRLLLPQSTRPRREMDPAQGGHGDRPLRCQGQLDHLQARLDTLTVNLGVWSRRLAVSQAEHQDTMRQLTATHAELHATRNQLATAQAHLAASASEAEGHKHQIAALARDSVIAREEVKHLETELRSLQEFMLNSAKLTRSELDDLRRQIAESAVPDEPLVIVAGKGRS